MPSSLSRGWSVASRWCAPGPNVHTMLRADLTDTAMARQLGTSTRTLQRRISKLMDAAGVEIRFQLGWRATELGWLGGTE